MKKSLNTVKFIHKTLKFQNFHTINPQNLNQKQKYQITESHKQAIHNSIELKESTDHT